MKSTHVEIAFKIVCKGIHNQHSTTDVRNCLVHNLLAQGAHAPAEDADESVWHAYWKKLSPDSRAHPNHHDLQHPLADLDENGRIVHQVSFTSTYKGVLMHIDRNFSDVNAYACVYGLRMSYAQRIIVVQYLLSQLGRSYNWRGYYCDFWPCCQVCTRSCPAGVASKEVMPFQLDPVPRGRTALESQTVWRVIYEEARWRDESKADATATADRVHAQLLTIPVDMPTVVNVEHGTLWRFSRRDLRDIAEIKGHGSIYMKSASRYVLFVPNPLGETNWFCSELVQASLTNAAFFDPDETISPGIVSPHDMQQLLMLIASGSSGGRRRERVDGRVFHLTRLATEDPCPDNKQAQRVSAAVLKIKHAVGPRQQHMQE